MKREEKQVIIDNLTEQIKAHKHIYISDISELDLLRHKSCVELASKQELN